MPGEIEDADGPAAIDSTHTRKIRVLNPQPVLPGAREEGQVERAGVEGGRHRPYELVRIFADAAALAQGRAIIDQRAHLFKSFRLSILYPNENRCCGNRLRRTRA